MSLAIDITGVPPERLLFAASPLAELTAMLHVLAVPEHHPTYQGWAAGTRAALKPDLAERLLEAEFLWRSSRADFLLPGRPAATLEEELDEVDRLDDETYVSAALVTTCGANRLQFGMPSPLTDPARARPRRSPPPRHGRRPSQDHDANCPVRRNTFRRPPSNRPASRTRGSWERGVGRSGARTPGR